MRKLPASLLMILSAVLVCGAAGITYLILFPVNALIAHIVASAVLGTLIPVYKYVKETEIRMSFLRAAEVGVDIQRYTIKWYLIIIYGSLILTGVIQFSAGVFGFYSGASLRIAYRMNAFNDEGHKLISGLQQAADFFLVTLLIKPISMFIFGKWVGKKGSKYGIPAMFLTILLIDVINIFSILIIPAAFLEERALNTKTQQIIGNIIWGIISFIIGVPITLLGYWLGQRKRLVAHLQDLFKVIPRETQTAIVNLIHKEIINMRGDKEKLLLKDSQEAMLNHQ